MVDTVLVGKERREMKHERTLHVQAKGQDIADVALREPDPCVSGQQPLVPGRQIVDDHDALGTAFEQSSDEP